MDGGPVEPPTFGRHWTENGSANELHASPKETAPQDAPTGRADEQLAHAHEQIKRADEQLTRMSEQLAKLERDARAPGSGRTCAHQPSAPPPGNRHHPRNAARAAITAIGISARKAGAPVPVGLLLLAAGFVVAALVWQSSYGGGSARCAAARIERHHRRRKIRRLPHSPRLLSFKWPRQRLDAAGSTAASRHRRQVPGSGAARAAGCRATCSYSTSSHAPAPQRLRIKRSCCKRSRAISRLLERNIEQLKANQQQTASENSKAIGELKASQEELKRTIAKVPAATAAQGIGARRAAGFGRAQA